MMVRWISILCALLGVTGAAGVAMAQAEGEAPAAVQTLQRLVGDWSGTATLTQGAESQTMQMALHCESVSGGMGVTCQSTMTVGEETAGSETDLFGYNAGDGLVHWYAVTSDGMVHDHRGDVDGTTWAFEYTGPMEGKLFSERIAMTWSGEDAVGFNSTVSLGPDELGSFSGALTRAE